MRNSFFNNALKIPLAFVILLVLSAQAQGDTSLSIEMEYCQRDADDSVVCDFRFSSSSSGSNALTGGPYSQALDDLGVVYDSTLVQIATESGLAVFFEFTRGVISYGKLFFEGVDKSADHFKLVTMRFNDGGWQQSNITIEN